MTKSLAAVLERCAKTAAWHGYKITNLTQRNHLNDTPLHTVCSWGEPDALKTLLSAGVDVNARGDRGCTPLFNAVIGENAEIVELLLRAGADPSIRSADGQSVLQYARNVSASPRILALLSQAKKRR